MKTVAYLLIRACVISCFSVVAIGSVFFTNNNPGYVAKVTMYTVVDNFEWGVTSFSCEHYIPQGQSLNFEDIPPVTYSLTGLTWIGVGGEQWSNGGLADYYYQRYGASQFDMNLWFSPGAHDALLGHALGGRATPNAVDALRRSSRDFDRKTQATADSHKHSMRREGQTVEEAIEQRDEFIRTTINSAREAALAGNYEQALKLLGEALHPVMDYSSPMHSDANGNPKIWRGMIRDGWGHSPNDLFGGERTQDITEEIYEFQDRIILSYFVTVFRGTPVAISVFENGFNPDQVVINIELPHN